MADKQVISKERVQGFGEVLTAEREVNAMLDLVKDETEKIGSKFLEPACGTGNFLIEILRRKLEVVKTKFKSSEAEFSVYSFIAVSSIYGIEIQEDNLIECRERLLNSFSDFYRNLYKHSCSEALLKSVKFLLCKNIVLGDALTMHQLNGDPIIFSEWEPIGFDMIKRRDFSYNDMVARSVVDELSVEHFLKQTTEDYLFIEPIKDFPVVHYLKVVEHE